MYTNIPFLLESHCRQQHGGSFKKLKIELPMTQQSHSWAYTLRSSYSLRKSLDMEVNLHREGGTIYDPRWISYCTTLRSYILIFYSIFTKAGAQSQAGNIAAWTILLWLSTQRWVYLRSHRQCLTDLRKWWCDQGIDFRNNSSNM